MNTKNHSRRLSVVWFIETSNTHNISVSLKVVYFVFSLLVFFLIFTAGSFIYLNNNLKKLSKTEEYVKELKVVTITNDAKKILDINSNKISNTNHASAIDEFDDENELDEDTGNNDNPSTDNLSPKEFNIEILPGSTPALAKSILFSNVKIKTLSSQIINVHFDISNANPEKNIAYLGRLCLILGTKDANNHEVFTYPESSNQDLINNDQVCNTGLPVKFQRLRPTDIQIKYNFKTFEYLKIIFMETAKKSAVIAKVTLNSNPQ